MANPRRGAGLEEVSLLEALRMDRGLTRFQVDNLTGVSHKTIKRYELVETTRPSSPPLEKLAAFYGVRASAILEDMRRFDRERREREELADAA